MGGEVALLRPVWSKPLDAHGFRCCDCCRSDCRCRSSVSMHCLHCSRNSTSSCCWRTSPKTKGVLLDTKRSIPKRFTSFETPFCPLSTKPRPTLLHLGGEDSGLTEGLHPTVDLTAYEIHKPGDFSVFSYGDEMQVHGEPEFELEDLEVVHERIELWVLLHSLVDPVYGPDKDNRIPPHVLSNVELVFLGEFLGVLDHQ